MPSCALNTFWISQNCSSLIIATTNHKGLVLTQANTCVDTSPQILKGMIILPYMEFNRVSRQLKVHGTRFYLHCVKSNPNWTKTTLDRRHEKCSHNNSAKDYNEEELFSLHRLCDVVLNDDICPVSESISSRFGRRCFSKTNKIF